MTDGWAVATARAILKITFAEGDNISNVTKNLTLPALVGDGVSVIWDCSSHSAISNDGSVKRPPYNASDITGKLKAT